MLYIGYAIPLGFLGNAATFTPAMNNIQGWFDKRRSTAVSIISVGPAIVAVLAPVFGKIAQRTGQRRLLVPGGIVYALGGAFLDAPLFRQASKAFDALAQAGARIYELPISYHGRSYAEGKKIGWRDGVAACWHILRYNLFA